MLIVNTLKDIEKYKKEGKGIYIWDNGDKYEGNWENDEREGEGIQFSANGDKQICKYSKGVFIEYIKEDSQIKNSNVS